MPTEFAIVDLFAGPGGLAEGFASIRGEDGSKPFNIVLSVEKESSAFETLRFRSFFRQFDGSPPAEYHQFLNGEIGEPNWSSLYPVEWEFARSETMQLELSSQTASQKIDDRLKQIKKDHCGKVILIGGPPCQAYSLVGRARNKGKEGYVASEDHRHFLYKEYIRILQTLMPAAFVMENVKGLLSSSVGGERIFDRVLDDLRSVGGGAYRLVPLSPRSGQSTLANMTHPPASDFIVRAEDHGIPQSRHRVIIVGIRADAASVDGSQFGAEFLPRSKRLVTVKDVLKGMPRLRSGLSDREDSEEAWRSETSRTMRDVLKTIVGPSDEERISLKDSGRATAVALATTTRVYRRTGGAYANVPASCPGDLQGWLLDPKLKRLP